MLPARSTSLEERTNLLQASILPSRPSPFKELDEIFFSEEVVLQIFVPSYRCRCSWGRQYGYQVKLMLLRRAILPMSINPASSMA